MSEEAGVRLTGVRATIARRMQHSLAETAQLSYFADADVTRLVELRAAWKRAGRRIGIEDCVVRALTACLDEFPEFNALLVGDVFSVAQRRDVAIAVSSPQGLVTPVLREAQELDLDTIAARRKDLVERAMAGTLQVSEMKGGTITISNLGLTRVRHFTPILNPPQVALIGIGRIEDAAGFGETGDVERRKRVGLSLTADHRVIDGDPAGRFLGALCERLEDADRLG